MVACGSFMLGHVMQTAAAEAAAKAEAQELDAWKRDATAVLAALDTTHAEKITEVLLSSESYAFAYAQSLDIWARSCSQCTFATKQGGCTNLIWCGLCADTD